MYLRPAIFAPSVTAAQSTRQGGLSAAPFHSLNLGLSVNDARETVMQNRERFFGGLGIDLSQLVISKQVHGTHVLVAEGPGIHEGHDASITNRTGVFLVVSVADCTPVLIHDEKNGAVAAIHAGWRGTAAGIVQKTLALMQQQYGTQGKDCKAFIGACISYDSFEVGEEVAQHFMPSEKRFDADRNKFFVDLKQANARQLLHFGLAQNQIEISDQCTVKNNNRFFSHRFEQGITGRMMAVIGLR